MTVKYTEFAQQAVTLADLFNETFKKPVAGRPANYRVQLAVPDGPSTAGGKQGTQHIKLVPMGVGTTHVVGWAHQADKEAELRSWEHLVAIHQERSSRGGLPDEVAYRKLVLDLKRFFEMEKLAVSVAAAPPAPEGNAEGPQAGGRGRSLILILAIAGGLVAAAVVALLLLGK
ncbi:MAG: hypothetical protein HY901_00975 [Deltaproteobacteria bacterium]|nr:hypothetical protein [Deltaproteobacteria bacterium]